MTPVCDNRIQNAITIPYREHPELDVLAGFDLKRYRPGAFIIEDNTFGLDWQTEDYMARHGYRRAQAIGCNYIYILD